MNQSKRVRLLLITLLCVSVSLSSPASSGTGEFIDATPPYVNLNLYYTYDEADINVMREAFEQASRLLWNATNGQIYIGTVRVSTNTAYQQAADVWVNDGAGGAFAHVAGIGTPGLHITLFRERHRWTDRDGPLGSEMGQFGIIHEFGHYGFNMRDEYNVGGSYPGACCVSSTSSIACIMDGGTTVRNDRTEFCTPSGTGIDTAHQTTPLTPQQQFRGESCWETMVSYLADSWGVTVTTPTDVDTDDPPGRPPINWVTIGDHLRMALSIDRSGSMSVDNKMPLARTAAGLFVDLATPDSGEHIAVTSFSNTARTDFALTEVTTTPDTRTQAVNIINTIAPQNMTAIGDGMRLALNEITGYGTTPRDDSLIETIVLMSDGVHNYGSETPSGVMPDLRDRGVRIFTIGLGDPAHPYYPLDESTLLDIADQTGGVYTRVADATDLPAVYAQYAAQIRGESESPELTGQYQPGTDAEHVVFVDSFTRQQTFVLNWAGEANSLQLTLRAPDGTVYDRTTTASNITYFERDNYIYFRVQKPQTGKWTMVIGGSRERKEAVKFTAQSFAESPGLSIAVAAPPFIVPGSRAYIRAAVVAAGVPVAGVDVRGYLLFPNGERMQITMHDDGDFKTNGDEKKGDGLYSALIPLQATGTYRVELTVANEQGFVAIPDETEDKWVHTPVAPFFKSAKTTFSVGRPEVTPPKDEGGRLDHPWRRIELVIGRRLALINNLSHQLDAEPKIVAGRTMVPLRFIAEALGAEVSYEAATKTITVAKKQRTVVLRIGDVTASVDGARVVLDAAPFIEHGRTMVPLRFLAEALDFEAQWEPASQTVTIKPL